MELDKTVDDPGRLARILLAVALAVVALRSFRTDRRVIGALAGAGAVGLGYTVATRPRRLSESDVGEAETIETTDEDGGMRCAACNDLIVVGQSRRPNANNEIVHEGCL